MPTSSNDPLETIEALLQRSQALKDIAKRLLKEAKAVDDRIEAELEEALRIAKAPPDSPPHKTEE
jgi:hypothetical protein